MNIKFGFRTDIGKKRKENQDCLFTIKINIVQGQDDSEIGFFGVADGMGGLEEGDKASRLAIEAVISEVLPKIIGLDELEPSTKSHSGLTTQEDILRKAFLRAHDLIFDYSRNKLIDGKIGTTLSVVLLQNNFIYTANVGDSPIYLICNDEVEELYVSDKWVDTMVRQGEMTEESALEANPGRNVLSQYIGSGKEIRVHTSSLSYEESCKILICSDGLTDPSTFDKKITSRELKELIKDVEDPQEACNKLVDEANNRGGKDNITAILIEVKHKEKEIEEDTKNG